MHLAMCVAPTTCTFACVGALNETKSSAWPRSLVAPTQTQSTHAAFLLHAARSAQRVCMAFRWCEADQMLSDRGSARVRPCVFFLFFFIILAKKRSCVITQRGCCYGIVGQPQSSARHIAAFSIHTHTIHVISCHPLPPARLLRNVGGRESRVGSCACACGGGFDSP
jgi:hypothetical protein